MHNHSHGHHHHHHHHSPTSGENGAKNILTAFLLNLSFAVIEFCGGLWTGSTAIMADALHDLGDSFSLGLAYFLHKKSQQHSTKGFSYGYARFSLMGAALNAVILVAGAVAVLSQAIPRLMNPVNPKVEGMIFLAIMGVAVNGIMVLRMQKGQTLNERILSWHLLEDVLGWAITLIVATVMYFVELPILDPILSILFTLFILRGVLKTFSETMKVFLQGVPQDIDVEKLKDEILTVENVRGVHDLHVWSLDGAKHVITIHIVVNPNIDLKTIHKLKSNVRHKLDHIGQIHATIEVETEADDCPEVNCVKI